MTALTNLLGLLLIAAIVWWFWLSRPRARRMQSAVIEVRVADGAYQPARIEVPAGQPVTLRFLRTDPAPCAQTVVFDALNIFRHLPLNEPQELTLVLPRPGEYEFACEMRMYRGSLVAK